MRSLRSIVAVAALSLSLPVLAVPTTTAYDFNTAPTSGTVGGVTYNGSNAAYGTNGGVITNFGDSASYAGLNNGGYFGNSATYAGVGGTALSTTVTAWASTGTGSNLNPATGSNAGINTTTTNNGTLQNAVLSAYWNPATGATGTYNTAGYALADTSRNTNGGAGNHDFTCTSSTCTPDTPNHAIDNDGAYETLLFSFSSAVTLSSVTLGYPGVDSSGATPVNNDGSSDATVLYCITNCNQAAFAGKTYSQLINGTGSNPTTWGYTDLLNLSASNDTGSTGLNVKSTMWMVGAYIADLPNQTGNDNNPDYIKIRAITTCTSAVCAVPEPSSIALFGIAAGALCVGRRRRQLRVA